MAQAVGRLGNWFNQELYGAPTTLPWGLKLNMEGSAIGHSEQCYDGATCPTGTLFHPTFLYEMIWNLIGAALIVFLGSKIMKKLKAGSLFAIYIMWYIERIIPGTTFMETGIRFKILSLSGIKRTVKSAVRKNRTESTELFAIIMLIT